MATPNITFFQKVDIALGLGQALFGTFLRLFVAPFRSSNTPRTLKRYLLLELGRRALKRLSVDQLQAIAGTTESNYLAWTKQQHLPARSVELPAFRTKAFWIGEPESKNLVIFYHGGGWAMPGADGHCKFVYSLVAQAKAVGKNVAVLFLQYDLAPGEHYPRQLTQAVELFRYAVSTLGKDPSNIMLLGDSSGANMVLGVLSHLMHPHPEIEKLELSAPLRGGMVSSPVCVLNTGNERFRTQEGQDPASAATIQIWINNILGSRIPDAYNQPLTNAPSWWAALDQVVRELLITVASVEMMAADTLACADKIKIAYPRLETFVSEADFHAQCTIGPLIGLELGEAAELMVSWAIDRY